MNLPTVILIGGPPGAGKTTLAKALTQRTGHGHLTADDLAVAARAVTSPASHPGLHLMPSGHVDYFTTGPGEKLVEDARATEATMWPVIERVLASHLRSGSPIIIDWWLLSPATVAAETDARVGSLWLHIDPDTLWARERAVTDFVADSPDPERMLENFMHRSLWRNELVRSEAVRAGLPVLAVSVSETVDELVDRAVALLASPTGVTPNQPRS